MGGINQFVRKLTNFDSVLNNGGLTGPVDVTDKVVVVNSGQVSTGNQSSDGQSRVDDRSEIHNMFNVTAGSDPEDSAQIFSVSENGFAFVIAGTNDGAEDELTYMWYVEDADGSGTIDNNADEIMLIGTVDCAADGETQDFHVDHFNFA